MEKIREIVKNGQTSNPRSSNSVFQRLKELASERTKLEGNQSFRLDKLIDSKINFNKKTDNSSRIDFIFGMNRGRTLNEQKETIHKESDYDVNSSSMNTAARLNRSNSSKLNFNKIVLNMLSFNKDKENYSSVFKQGNKKTALLENIRNKVWYKPENSPEKTW